MTQSPPALVKLTAAFQDRTDRPKSYIMAGIVGDASHMNPPRGYHVSPRDAGFAWGAYSLSTSRDKAGAKKYPDYASAWDLHFEPADMILATTRLIASAKDMNDPRLDAVAEIAGTTNGHSVHAYYINTGTDDPNNTGGWDDGHLSHVHLSISRDDCDNPAALAPILDVICGVPLTKEFTMDKDAAAAFAKINEKLDFIESRFIGTDGKSHTNESTVAHVTQGAGYASKKGTLWRRLLRFADKPAAK